eukprot:7625039-Ditylum_brightwellii.AAC.1
MLKDVGVCEQKQKQNAFKEWQRNDLTLMAQWLYIIDCSWQRFDAKVKDGKIDISIMATGDSAIMLTAECSGQTPPSPS